MTDKERDDEIIVEDEIDTSGGDEDEIDDIVAADKDEDSETEGELSDIEELALEIGWNPDHEGDEKVDAATFIRRSRDIQDSMRKTNNLNQREITKLQRGVKDIKAYYKKQDEFRQKTLEDEIEGLKDKRYEAIEEGDVEKVKTLDDKIEKSQEEAKPLIKDDEQEPDSNPDFDDWQEQNKWYGTDNELTQFFDAQAGLPRYEGVPFKRAVTMITDDAKTIFADKFPAGQGKGNGGGDQSGKPAATPRVEGTKPRRSVKMLSRSDLSPEQRDIMKNIKSVDETFDEKDYLKSLHKMGEI